MNEVTKIHLGRQSFTIATDAHHKLTKYLEEIQKEVVDKEVVDEIELRMAELLAERGVTGDKVILPADVDFLKEQLGSPKDFGEGEDTQISEDKPGESKRLFRDTDNAILAGVAAGLAAYFGVDALLVRILFIIATFTGGWGILVYLVLWIVVPEAKTSSEKLQMAGKPVTVDSLKEVVERADVKGAAQRASNSLAGPINTLFRFVLKCVGLVFILIGLGIFFWLVFGAIYAAAHSGAWLQGNIFPVGLREHVLVFTAMGIAALLGVFMILFGVAFFRRKWPVRSWITGILIGLTFIGLAGGSALAADVYPNIRDRYNANVHTTDRQLPAFTTLNALDPDADVNFQTASTYYVSFNYYDHPNLNTVKTTVVNGTLTIDTSQFDGQRHCQTFCLPDTYNLTITVHAPNADQLSNTFDQWPVKPPTPPMPVMAQ